jgi:hypothetical protein
MVSAELLPHKEIIISSIYFVSFIHFSAIINPRTFDRVLGCNFQTYNCLKEDQLSLLHRLFQKSHTETLGKL